MAARQRRSIRKPSRANRKREERARLREDLGFGLEFPGGREIIRPMWDEARCIGWAIEAFAPEKGYPPEQRQALRGLKAAADESPQVISSKAKTAIAEAERVYPAQSRGIFRCFQLRAQAAVDAAQDLRSLGYVPSDGLIDAYLREIGSWRSILPTHSELDDALAKAEDVGSPDARSALPRSSSELAGVAKGMGIVLATKDYAGWKSDLRLVCRVQLIHDRALQYRQEHRGFPERAWRVAERFRELLDARIRTLHSEHLIAAGYLEVQVQVAHVALAAEELLKNLESPPARKRAANFRSRLEALSTALSKFDRGTEYERRLQFHVSGFLIPVLSGVLAKRVPTARGSLARLRRYVVPLLESLHASCDRIHLEQLEKAIGTAAACVSQWRRRMLERRLKEADLLLQPLGSYLRGWRDPKQLRVRYALDIGLRARLGPEHREFAKSKAIAAAFKVYAPRILGPPGAIKDAALNTIEKLRARIGRVEALEAMSEFKEWRDT